MTTNKFHGSMSGCLVLSIHASIFYKSPWSMATMAVQTCDNLWQLSQLLTLGGDNCSGFLLSFFHQSTVLKRRAVVAAFWVSICLVKFWPYSRPRNSFLVLNNLLLLQWTDERKLCRYFFVTFGPWQLLVSLQVLAPGTGSVGALHWEDEKYCR